MRTVFATAAVMFALAACGGGGGGGGMTPPQSPVPPPAVRSCDPPQSDICIDFSVPPVFPWDNLGNPSWIQIPDPPGAVRDRSSNAVVIGPGVYGLELHDPGDLDPAGAHGGYALHYGRVNDGTGASTLTSLLTANDVGAARAVRRWGNTPPTVHVAPGTTAQQVAEARLIVKYINSALPRDWQLQWSDERLNAAVPAVPGRTSHHGQIRMAFAPASTWPEAGHETLGLTQVETRRDEILSARIWLDPARNPHKTVRLKVIAHELLHALGREHADPARFPRTILHSATEATPAIPPVLHQIDNEALLAVYGFLEAGQNSHGVLQALGPWETESSHLAATLAFGEAGRIGFGASERNALVRPWAVGTPVPGIELSANTSLSGQASWSGRLVGLTPASQPVAGRAVLTVTLADLSGRLDFTNLEVWAQNAAPGPAGSGTRWQDGDLSYEIAVTANGFRHSAASRDTGEIEGIFLGAGHEAMVGVLTRADLSAGFGAIRQ